MINKSKFLLVFVVYLCNSTSLPCYDIKLLSSLQTHKVVVGCIDTGIGEIMQGHKGFHYCLPKFLEDKITLEPITYGNLFEALLALLYPKVRFPSIMTGKFYFLENAIIKALSSYCNDKSLDAFVVFLKRYGMEQYVESHRNDLSLKGYEVISKIKTLLEPAKKVFFKSQMYLKPLIPHIYTRSSPHYHGAAIARLIVGDANTITILSSPVFRKEGTGNIHLFLEALVFLLKHKIPIICMSLQIPEESLSAEMRELLTYLIRLFPYSIAPSGNNRESKNYVSFPGSVATFSVGAYEDDIQMKVCDFSQYSSTGPDFLMPGGLINIFYYDNLRNASGTSFAAALYTHYLALLVSVTHDLSINQVKYLCYKCSFFHPHGHGWRSKSLWGTLDISKALFIVLTLHTLKTERLYMRYFCEHNYEKCAEVINVFLCNKPSDIDVLVLIKEAHNEVISLFKGEKEQKISTLLHYEYRIAQKLQKPTKVPLSLLENICGSFDASRIKEYSDSYFDYYWS